METRGYFTAKLKFIVVFLAALAALSACDPRKIGYGVLLWSPDETVLETGSVLPVYEESRIKGTYTVPKTGKKETIETPTWRLQFFPKEKEAAAFAEKFEEVKNIYASSNRKALPVREKADRLSARIYRLRENEKMKILELGTTPADENGLQGFWYKVLTEEGVAGYCFDYYLTVFDARTNIPISTSRDPAAEAVARVLSAVWKPSYYREMIAERRIDLAKFKPSFGLFFSEDPKQIRIALPSGSASVPYTQLRKTNGDTFIAEGSDVQLQLRGGGNELVVFYTTAGGRRSDIFVSFEAETEIEEIVTAETERRKEIFAAFLAAGKNLRSTAYGEIVLSDDGAFSWKGFDRLVPTAIPPGVQGAGRAEFSVFIGAEVKQSYNGVVTFRFSGAGAEKASNFFYRFTDGGVQFIHIPPANIEEGVVRRESMNSLVIFFSRS